MFLGHTNPKLFISVNAVVVNFCKITELRKRKLKVKIYIIKKNLIRIFKFYLISKTNKAKIYFICKKYYSYE